ncbi:villin-1-like [Styela clava]
MAPEVYNAEFEKAGKKPGLQIWRIEKMEMVTVPTDNYGNFYTGDAYIILHTADRKSKLAKWELHFWIGAESSQDEQGAAAMLTTYLDDYLGGEPVQHREVQGNESEIFRSYFKKGLIYQKGGVASGFNHVETNKYDVRRLLHVKGKKNVVATEVDLSWDSMNVGDVFILDLGKYILQWNGPESNRMERIKAMQLAKDINSRERGGRGQVFIIEGSEEKSTPKLFEGMEQLLGKKKQLKPATPDDVVSRAKLGNIKLFNVSDQSGQLMVQEVATKPLSQSLLQHEDCYILDHGGSKVYVWKGKKATREEKSGSMTRAMGYIKAKGYHASTQIETVNDGAESAMFKQLFKDWRDKTDVIGKGKLHTRGSIAHIENKKFDASTMHNQPKVAANERMPDDGSGEIEVWRIEKSELAPVDKSTYGQFYGGDCYIILYTYMHNNRERRIIYYWLGRHATQDEITACAFQAAALDRIYDDEPTQVRVTMGKEPRHFLAMFKGKVIIYEGGTSRAGGQSKAADVRLFQVHGKTKFDTKAIEVAAKAGSLNSNDVFVLVAPQNMFMWSGKGASGDEREMARLLAGALGKRELETVPEGHEDNTFWDAVGGRGEYASVKALQVENPDHDPRLFECSNQTGTFKCTEMFDFTQEDLDEDDVMLLDTFSEIYLWIGKNANKLEKESSMATAIEYLTHDPCGRDKDTPIITIKQGFEPPTFTGWFTAWDIEMWSNGKTYEELKAELGSDAGFEVVKAEVAKKVVENRAPLQKFPYSELVKKGDELSTDVDPARKEEHLEEAEFQEIFGMTLVEFQKMPGWKKEHMKKSKKLF